jgi:rhodanese-related sulfurtransferase
MDGLPCNDLQLLLKTPIPPLIIDARQEADYAAAAGVISGAIRRDPEAVAGWAYELELARPIAVYDANGGNTSQSVAKTLRDLGLPARYLESGFEAWAAAGGAITARPGKPSLWVTRERPKIDRIACPWLIRRFIDPDAQFLYVPAGEVLKTASETGAIPYDIPGVTLTHRGERCSFDAFIEDYKLTQPALLQLADMVRGADTDRMELAPQAAGLFAISLGLSANIADDHTMLRYGLVIYDALYAWIVSAQSETHNWPPAIAREASS